MMKKFRREKKTKGDSVKDENGEPPVKTKKKHFFWIFSKKNKNKKEKRTDDTVEGNQLQICTQCNRPNTLSTVDAVERLPQKASSPMYSSQPLLEKSEEILASESGRSDSLDGSLSSGFHDVHPSEHGKNRFRERTGTRRERRLSLPSMATSFVEDSSREIKSTKSTIPEKTETMGYGTSEPSSDPRVLLLHPPVFTATTDRYLGYDSADELQSDARSCDSGACAERSDNRTDNRLATRSKVGQLWIGQEHPVTFGDGLTKMVSWSLEGGRIIGSISDGRTREADTQTELEIVSESISLPRDQQDLNDFIVERPNLYNKDEKNFDAEQTFLQSFGEKIDNFEECAGTPKGDPSKISDHLNETDKTVENSGHLVTNNGPKDTDVTNVTKQLSNVSPSNEISLDFDSHVALGSERSRPNIGIKGNDVTDEEVDSCSISAVPTEQSSSSGPQREPEVPSSTLQSGDQSKEDRSPMRYFSDVIWLDASDADNRKTSGKVFARPNGSWGEQSHKPLRPSFSTASNNTLRKKQLEKLNSSSNVESEFSGRKSSVTSSKSAARSPSLYSANWKSVSDLSRYGSKGNLSETSTPPPSVTDPEYASMLAKRFQAINARFRTLAADAESRRANPSALSERRIISGGRGVNDAFVDDDVRHDDVPLTQKTGFYRDFTDESYIPNSNESKIENTEAERYRRAETTEDKRYRSAHDLRSQFTSEDATSFRSSASSFASSSIFCDGRVASLTSPEVAEALQSANSTLNRPGKKTLHQQLSDVRRHFDQWHRDLTTGNRWPCNNSMGPSIDFKGNQDDLANCIQSEIDKVK